MKKQARSIAFPDQLLRNLWIHFLVQLIADEVPSDRSQLDPGEIPSRKCDSGSETPFSLRSNCDHPGAPSWILERSGVRELDQLEDPGKNIGYFRNPECLWSKYGCKAEDLVPVFDSPRSKSLPESGVRDPPRENIGYFAPGKRDRTWRNWINWTSSIARSLQPGKIRLSNRDTASQCPIGSSDLIRADGTSSP